MGGDDVNHASTWAIDATIKGTFSLEEAFGSRLHENPNPYGPGELKGPFYRKCISEGDKNKIWTNPSQLAGIHQERCPVQHYGGSLCVNWHYGNNDARIIVGRVGDDEGNNPICQTSGSDCNLPGETLNDDSGYGLGMELSDGSN